MGLCGGKIESKALNKVFPLALPSLRSTAHPLNHFIYKISNIYMYNKIFDSIQFVSHTLSLSSNMLSPCQPDMGTNATALGLYPIFLMYVDTSLTISL